MYSSVHSSQGSYAQYGIPYIYSRYRVVCPYQRIVKDPRGECNMLSSLKKDTGKTVMEKV
jgi:hypothetical protein